MRSPIRILRTGNYTYIRFFRWNIYLTAGNKLRKRDKKRNRARTMVKHQRLEKAGYRCELCGSPIDIKCTLFRIYPQGHPERNTLENVRVICGTCNHHCDRVGGYRPMIEEHHPEDSPAD